MFQGYTVNSNKINDRHLTPHLCRCRTDSSSVESQYHALYQTSEMLNKTSAKISSVISASQTVIR